MASNFLLTQTLCLFPKSSVGAKPWSVVYTAPCQPYGKYGFSA
jgi:hypothetical protein